MPLRIISLLEWWKNEPRLPLLDLRPQQDYEQRHIIHCSTKETTVVHIPLDELVQRSFELPPRTRAFVVLVSNKKGDLERAQEILLCNSNGRHRQRPWNVQGAIVCSDDTWRQAKDLGLHSAFEQSSFRTGEPPFQPLDRLWQPDLMVEHILLPLLLKECGQPQHLGEHPEQQRFEVWDLGAGFGRDVSFLAEGLVQNKLDKFCVVGLDQRKRDNAANEPCRAFWRRRRVDDVTDCRCVDLSDMEAFWQLLQTTQEDSVVVKCIFAVRFWSRLLVQELASSKEVAAGSIFAMSHFGKPTVDAPWNFDHPKEKHVLNRQELRDIFSQSPLSWTILHNEVVLDSDHGRMLIQFVAQRQS